jgi:hypothetical protein
MLKQSSLSPSAQWMISASMPSRVPDMHGGGACGPSRVASMAGMSFAQSVSSCFCASASARSCAFSRSSFAASFWPASRRVVAAEILRTSSAVCSCALARYSSLATITRRSWQRRKFRPQFVERAVCYGCKYCEAFVLIPTYHHIADCCFEIPPKLDEFFCFRSGSDILLVPPLHSLRPCVLLHPIANLVQNPECKSALYRDESRSRTLDCARAGL